MTTEQPEALQLADDLDAEAGRITQYTNSRGDLLRELAAAELRRQHAEIETLRTGYDAARLEIASLHTQMEAVGAGGMEPLRKRECLHQITEPAQAQPVASESLVKWASLIELAQTDWHTGYEAARAYVKVQLECAAPQPAAQALDAGQWTQEDLREFCAIGRATNRSAVDLPDFSRICIDLENGSGAVYWLDNKAGRWRCIDSGDLLSTQIDAAIGAAIAAQQGGANG